MEYQDGIQAMVLISLQMTVITITIIRILFLIISEKKVLKIFMYYLMFLKKI